MSTDDNEERDPTLYALDHFAFISKFPMESCIRIIENHAKPFGIKLNVLLADKDEYEFVLYSLIGQGMRIDTRAKLKRYHTQTIITGTTYISTLTQSLLIFAFLFQATFWILAGLFVLIPLSLAGCLWLWVLCCKERRKQTQFMLSLMNTATLQLD